MACRLHRQYSYDTLVPHFAWVSERAEAGWPSQEVPRSGGAALLPSFVGFVRSQAKIAEAVAEVLGWSKAKISRYELARSGLKPNDVKSLAGCLRRPRRAP